MTRLRRITALALFALGAAALPLLVQPSAAVAQSQQRVLEEVISDVERTIINRYFGKQETTTKKSYKKGKKKGLPPGLAKRGSLPPGLQKQLDENGALPPGLAKRDLPNDLLSSLPRRRHSKFVVVDDDVVLIDILTNKALDVLEDVLH